MSQIKSQVAVWAKQIKSRSWIWPDSYSVGNVSHLQTLLRQIIPSKSDNIYGSHFIFNNQNNSQLGLDGYDNYQAPVNEAGVALFLRRMWVSGLLEYYGDGPKINDAIICKETINSVRTVSDSVFVTIGRDFAYHNGTSVMKEVRTLIYTNEPFVKRESGDQIENLGDALHSYNFTLSLNDVMRFSSLSYNLHKIHYDVNYCRSENLANVVASGPFLVLIMLHYFASVFDLKIKSFKYRNSEPCYIDDHLNVLIRQLGGKEYEVYIAREGRKLCGGKVVVE